MQNKQKILIIGSGGREHAIGWKIKQSEKYTELYFAPGNAGTLGIGTNVDIKATDIPKLVEFVKKENIGLTLAVQDEPLALGVVDEFRKENLSIWGPTKVAARIEWSKAFSKDFMRRHNLPTAKFEVFNNFEKAKNYLKIYNLPIVIKASGLAAGKGVIIAQSKEEAERALEDIMGKKIFGASGDEVVIEEFLEGPEISIHALSDGENYKMFPSSQDHKRIGDGDKGPNTGGMGVVGPLPFVDSGMMNRIEHEVIAPALKGMADDGVPFEGILYPSLMLTKEGPKIIEFNARFGDPEAEVYMRLLDTDLLEIINSCIDKKINEQEIKWKNLFACNIALASSGYPGTYEKGKIISGIAEAELDPNVIVFHAGTKYDAEIEDPEQSRRKNLVTNGGRVLGVSAVGNTLGEALDTAYKAISKISFEGMQYRKDIGKKSL